MWYVTLYVTVNSSPEWPQLQLDLFLSLFGLISSFALSALCIMYESVIQLGSCDDKNLLLIRGVTYSRGMCSILGMDTIVTMVCYGMQLSLT